MKVVEVIEALTRGGAERLVLELAEEFRRSGVETQVLCLSEPGPWAAMAEEKGYYAGCLGKRRGIDLKIVGKLRRRLAELAPDVVHAHLFTASLWTRLAALARRDWRLVVTLHNVDEWRGPVRRMADRMLYGVPDAYVAVGSAVRDYYLDHGLRGERMTLIPNGIRGYDGASRAPLAIVPPMLRACGRLVPQKGFHYLVEAAAILKRSGARFQLEIIGDGPQRGRIGALVKEHDVADCVALRGERDDARALIAGADAVIFPSVREGLPLVLLEAFHAGRAGVASRLPAVCDVAADGIEAILVEPGNAAALAGGIARLLADPIAAGRMAAAARERARREFGIERTAAAYLELFGRLTGAAIPRARSPVPGPGRRMNCS